MDVGDDDGMTTRTSDDGDDGDDGDDDEPTTATTTERSPAAGLSVRTRITAAVAHRSSPSRSAATGAAGLRAGRRPGPGPIVPEAVDQEIAELAELPGAGRRPADRRAVHAPSTGWSRCSSAATCPPARSSWSGSGTAGSRSPRRPRRSELASEPAFEQAVLDRVRERRHAPSRHAVGRGVRRGAAARGRRAGDGAFAVALLRRRRARAAPPDDAHLRRGRRASRWSS